MDSFSIIQHFFTQMQCPQCGRHLEEKGVALLREEAHTFLVHLECQHCHSDIGNAMIGIETSLGHLLRHTQSDSNLVVGIEEGDALHFELDAGDDDDEMNLSELFENIQRSEKMPRFAGGIGLGGVRRRYQDPELTPAEKERFQDCDPIGYDDVLKAHHFFENLGRNWQSFIPEEMRQSQIGYEAESLVEETPD
jgi:hypothetical protein